MLVRTLNHILAFLECGIHLSGSGPRGISKRLLEFLRKLRISARLGRILLSHVEKGAEKVPNSRIHGVSVCKESQMTGPGSQRVRVCVPEVNEHYRQSIGQMSILIYMYRPAEDL